MTKAAAVLASLFAFALAWPSPAAGADGRDRLRPGEEELLVRPVGTKGKTFAVVRGPGRPVAALPVAEGAGVDRDLQAYELRAEVRSPDGPPVVVAAQVVPGSWPPDPVQDVIVLDALVEPDAATLAVARGPTLAVWHVSLIGGDGWFRSVEPGPPPPLPPLLADDPAPLRKAAHVTLARGGDGLLTYTVFALGRFRAAYVQAAKDGGAFKMTKHEDLTPPPPATQPRPKR